MILDQLTNAEIYHALHPLFVEGFRFITGPGQVVAAGRYELADGAYAMVQEYDTKPVEGAKYEAHRRFIDIQYLARGAEVIYYANLERLQAGAYVPEKDMLDLEGNGSTLQLSAGEFAIFYPQDAHMPSRVTAAGPRPVRKVVVKIPVSG